MKIKQLETNIGCKPDKISIGTQTSIGRNLMIYGLTLLVLATLSLSTSATSCQNTGDCNVDPNYGCFVEWYCDNQDDLCKHGPPAPQCNGGEVCGWDDCGNYCGDCTGGKTCQQGACVMPTTTSSTTTTTLPYTCEDFCVDLGLGYTSGTCRQTKHECANNNEDWQNNGNAYCNQGTGAPAGAGNCCCSPGATTSTSTTSSTTTTIESTTTTIESTTTTIESTTTTLESTTTTIPQTTTTLASTTTTIPEIPVPEYPSKNIPFVAAILSVGAITFFLGRKK